MTNETLAENEAMYFRCYKAYRCVSSLALLILSWTISLNT